MKDEPSGFSRRALLGGAIAVLASPAIAAQTMLRIGDPRGGAQPLMQAAGANAGMSRATS